MRPPSPILLVLLVSLGLAGCRQADGAMPTPGGDDPNRIEDMTRGLQGLPASDDEAVEGLAGDLLVWTDQVDGAVPPTRDLAQKVVDAIRGRTLNEESARRLAQTLWMTSSARDLSDRQIEDLERQMRMALDAIGAAPDKAQAAAEQAAAVQRIVTDRERRWYELF
jgi:hypothetical protein